MRNLSRNAVIEWLNSLDYKNELSDYIEHKSRSHFPDEVESCAKFSKQLLESAGLEVESYKTDGNPVLFGQRLANNPAVPTVLFYGHYDVQPEGNLDDWETPPFELIERDGKFFGRGTADNKGQHYAHILALRYLQKFYPEIYDNVNIKFILDGDEERGSFSLPSFFEQAKEKLAADFVYISDGPSLHNNYPSIIGSVRGILTFQVTISYNQEDLHSGNFGGLARSATGDLIALLSDLVDINGKCKIKGFYDDVVDPVDNELKLMEEIEFIFDELDRTKNLSPARNQDGRSRQFQHQFWPTFNINGISAGGVGRDRRTIIPQKAHVSVDCRLVPNQNSEKIKGLITDFLDTWALNKDCANALTYEFEHAMEPVNTSITSQNRIIIQEAVSKGFDKSPLLVPRLGGSLPTYLFDKILKQEIFLVPYALPDENNHAPNENLDIEYFMNGVASTVFLIDVLSRSF